MWNDSTHTSEIKLIRMCCRYLLGKMTLSDCVPYLNAIIDEARLFELLEEEYVLLLVYQVLSRDLKPYVPHALLDKLAQKTKPILATQLALMATERSIEEAFKAAALPHIFLKGPRLNQTLWGRRMMRYSGDLDVLVSPNVIFQADALLNSLGFQPRLSKKALRFHQIFHRITTKKDASYWHADLSHRVELHWKSYCSEFISKLPVFDDEQYALYLCLHAAKHGWSRLIWLVDIVAFIQIKNIDILNLKQLAKKNHIEPVVSEAILLAAAWLGIKLVRDAELAGLNSRKKLLEKRLVWGKKGELSHSLWQQLSKRFLMNAFCSHAYIQMRLWIQVTLGTIIMTLSKAQ